MRVRVRACVYVCMYRMCHCESLIVPHFPQCVSKHFSMPPFSCLLMFINEERSALCVCVCVCTVHATADGPLSRLLACAGGESGRV